DIGFDRNDVLLAHTNLNEAGIAAEQFLPTFQEIETRLRALPGVVSAGRSVLTPVGGMHWNRIINVDTPGAPTGFDAIVFLNGISPGYFETMRTPLLAGRNFTPDDTKTSPLVAIVNTAFGRKFFPSENPVGKYFNLQQHSGLPGKPIQIVGLVKDAKYR